MFKLNEWPFEIKSLILVVLFIILTILAH